MICQQCGKSFEPKNKNRLTKFCGTECYHKSRIGQKVAVASKQQVVCKQCGKIFTTSAYNVERSCANYCSSECHFLARGWTKRQPIECEQCGKVFRFRGYGGGDNYQHGKYCSHACYAKVKAGKAQEAYRNGDNPRYKGIKVRVGKKNRYAHVLIAEGVLGRRLVDHEQVHHVNGNKLDNRNCNLVICDRSFHSWLHHRMSSLYQQEHFKHS